MRSARDAHQVLRDPLLIERGHVRLPASSDTARLVDWEKVERYRL